jgi:hypothetical protein
MSGTDIATIIVIPVAFIIIYGLSCIAQRELRSEKKAREARELIKEMREQLSAVVSTASTPTTKGELVYVNNYIEMRELLNKSKEYT